MDEIVNAGVAALSRQLAAGDVSPLEVARRYLERIAKHDPTLKAFIHVRSEEALVESRASERRYLARAPLSPLDGVPLALKDNIDVAGAATTAGIGARRGAVAVADAFVVERLRSAGAVVVGKLNMHEAALGSTTDNPWFGRCRNPHATGFIPGGSSGGSGSAVAAGLCAAALGTDTLGSIREPAHFCGTVGHKPSHGLVSTRGVFPLCRELDTVGPLARSVADAAALMQVIAAHDVRCAQARAAPAALDFALPAECALHGVTLGVFESAAVEPEADVRKAFLEARRVLEQLGASVLDLGDCGLDLLELVRDAVVLCAADLADALAEEPASSSEDLSPAMRQVVDWGTSLSAVDLAAARRRLGDAQVRVRELFRHAQALILPTAPLSALPFEKADEIDPDSTLFVGWVNVARAAATSVPMGMTAQGLPLGLQVVAPEFHDPLTLRIAQAYESMANHQIQPRGF